MGAILVFDFDETIMHSGDFYLEFNQSYLDDIIRNNSKEIVLRKLNPFVLEIILKASAVRGTKVEAIFILSNCRCPKSEKLIEFVDDFCLEHVITSGFQIGKYKKSMEPSQSNFRDKDFFFDYIATKYSSERLSHDKSIKSLEVVKNMYKKSIGKEPEHDFYKRVYMIDDRPEQIIRQEFKELGIPNHYIQITPPYKELALGLFTENMTDFSHLLPIISD